MKKAVHVLVLIAVVAGGSALAQQKGKPVSPTDEIARGRYLVKTAACNDCHSPGYLAANGKTDEKTWLTGDTLGWRGPWGTTYPSNLRLFANAVPAEVFMARARSEGLRPPMPWFNLTAMKDEDLRAIYRYLRHLGPAGERAPAALPPGDMPKGPYVQFPAPPAKN